MPATSWHRPRLTSAVDAAARARTAVRKHRAWARARRRATRIIRVDLGLRPGQGLQDLIDAVARERQRPITVLRLALPPHVSGFCVQGQDKDTVVVTANTSERQGLHVLLHELYHLLRGAPAADDALPVAACDLLGLGTLTDQMPSLPADVVHEVLSRPAQLRTGYEEDEEWSAEVFATIGLLMLSLDDGGSRTGSLTSAFANRWSDV
ncbi:hypothetical protein [Streptomyces sp. NPDC059063]|uniref:hypothetical protein n=1 Tax=unclassified Streptomyces TaxID=2593676 RepID=UPI00367A467E